MWKRACVGAGLLANAVGQPFNLLTDTPPSRASPLPHWFCGVYWVFTNTGSALYSSGNSFFNCATFGKSLITMYG